MNFLAGDEDDEINVYIGDENVDKAFKDFSIITFKNKNSKKNLGTIAIIGPTRMDYDEVLSALEYITEELNKYFDELNKGGNDGDA